MIKVAKYICIFILQIYGSKRKHSTDLKIKILYKRLFIPYYNVACYEVTLHSLVRSAEGVSSEFKIHNKLFKRTLYITTQKSNSLRFCRNGIIK